MYTSDRDLSSGVLITIPKDYGTHAPYLFHAAATELPCTKGLAHLLQNT